MGVNPDPELAADVEPTPDPSLLRVAIGVISPESSMDWRLPIVSCYANMVGRPEASLYYSGVLVLGWE